MVHEGRIQELNVVRTSAKGLVLGTGDEEVLLPASEAPPNSSNGVPLKVFVFRAADGALTATLRMPKAQVGEFATLRVEGQAPDGALVDLGNGVPLLVPRAEQKKPLSEGRWHVVRVASDERTGRPYGSTRIEDFLDNAHLTVKERDEVTLLVYARSELGFSVIVNGAHQGLVHSNEIFRHLSIGDRLTGYIKRIRDDKKLDITLQAIGYRKHIDGNTELLAKRLRSGSGFLPLTDKSSAEEIYAEFGISKKAFKQALGALYKERLVRIDDEGIIWIGK